MEYAIVFLPLIGSFISGFFGKRLRDKYCQILTSSLVSISGILSLLIFFFRYSTVKWNVSLFLNNILDIWTLCLDECVINKLPYISEYMEVGSQNLFSSSKFFHLRLII